MIPAVSDGASSAKDEASADPGGRATPDPRRAEHLARALEHAAHYLPAQAPLEVFVHHNTLHAFQHLSFHEAVVEAERILGARGRLPPADYREAHRQGRISREDLDAAIAELRSELGEVSEGAPGVEALTASILLAGIGPITRASLEWEIGERDADRSFGSDVPESCRKRIVSETRTWVQRELDAGTSVASLAAQIVGETSDRPVEVQRRLRSLLGIRPDRAALEQLLRTGAESVAVSVLWATCRRLAPPAAPAPARRRTHRELVLGLGLDDPTELVHSVLIPACASFLDRGQTHWSMPHREQGFFLAWAQMATAGRAVRPAWLADLGRRLRDWLVRGLDATGVTLELLDELGIDDDELDAKVERTLLRLPGWAGMFRRLETAPGPIGRSHATIALADFFAVRLVLDVQALRDVARRAGFSGPLSELRGELEERLPRPAPADRDAPVAWPLFRLAQHMALSAPALLELGADGTAGIAELIARLDGPIGARVWHEAYERGYREALLGALSDEREAGPQPPPRSQAIFCIDDRSESIRRHFEELSPEHETFGTAGFFNLAIAYQGIDDPSTFPLCPVVVQPRHRIEEHPATEHVHLAEVRRRWRQRLGWVESRLERASRSLVWGPFWTALAGAGAALPLLVEVFAPRTAARLRREATRRLLPELRTELRAAPSEEGAEATRLLLTGFSLEETTTRVGSLLENIGLTRGFAPLVALIGHDSTSVNNPHFAAYSCGACGGRSGGPNARLFARMVNQPEVREALRARGIDIPEDTVFVGGVHDTCADTIHFYDLDAVPSERAPDLAELERVLGLALDKNAHERGRRFESAPRGAAPVDAHEHVEGRAVDLSQPRPELGHATNAACIVGRRARSRGLFLDRRTFLVSYDPSIDATGAILERTLAAVVPVCAGINLEYFFSTTDNEHYGAGTKLPHNVTGLVGVMNGASSDLRTGLPKQMIEIHEPIRLQLVVEAEASRLEAIVRSLPEVVQLADGEWLQFLSMDPSTGALSRRWSGGEYTPWERRGPRLPRVRESADWYGGHSSFVAPARIEPRHDRGSLIP